MLIPACMQGPTNPAVGNTITDCITASAPDVIICAGAGGVCAEPNASYKRGRVALADVLYTQRFRGLLNALLRYVMFISLPQTLKYIDSCILLLIR
jgi:hypothetical protein